MHVPRSKLIDFVAVFLLIVAGANDGEAAYFFTLRQPPLRGGGGRRRRTASGHWKAMGKEKQVFVQLQGPSAGSGSGKRLLVGVKTALAFHRGKGKTRTDWVMHEYRLAAAAGAADQKKSPSDLQSCEWVVCRVSLKSRARRPSADAGSETTAGYREDDAGDHHQPSPSSSCVTDTSHASDHQEEVSSSTSQ
jgi:hypothetical protein